MSDPTWIDYIERFPPYPPFQDPEDWRELVGGKVSDRDAQRVQQLVDGAELDHHAKHGRRDHPWCVTCEGRRYDFETEVEGYKPTVHPNDSQARLWEAVDEACVDRDTVRRAHRRIVDFVKAGWTMRPEDADQVAKDFDLPRAIVDAVEAHVQNAENWGSEQQRRSYAVASRAARYLVLHRGAVPVDSYDPSQDEAAEDSSEYLDRDELDDLPTPEPLVEGVLTRHAYAVLIGRDHTYKTFVALDWSLCLATGKQWQGKRVDPVKVLYVAGEGAYGLAKRVNAWEYAWGRDVEPERFVVRRSAVNLYRGGPPLEELLQRIADDGYGLVVIDTLRRASGGAEGNGSDMGVVVDNIERIKRATDDGTVLVIAHTDKGDNDARGFSGIEDDADIVWHAKTDDAGSLTLKNTKQKDQAEHPAIQLHMLKIEEHDSLVIEAGGPAATPATTESQARLLVTMRESFSETGATSTELMSASGVPRTTFYRARNELLKASHLEQRGSRYYLPQSPQGPTAEPVADQQVSHESHDVPPSQRNSPTSPTALMGGTWDAAPGTRGIA